MPDVQTCFAGGVVGVRLARYSTTHLAREAIAVQYEGPRFFRNGTRECRLRFGGFEQVLSGLERFHVEGKGFKYYMSPVATTTGTVRLEDAKGGAVWLQIANKSMLMNQRAGQRLADECMSPEQVAVAEAIKKNPPVSVLDPLPAAK